MVVRNLRISLCCELNVCFVLNLLDVYLVSSAKKIANLAGKKKCSIM